MDKINLVEYEFEGDKNTDFLNFVREQYKDSKHVDSYIQTLRKIKEKENPSFNYIKTKNFIAYEGDKVIGHISAMIDIRLKEDVGLIGFYECVDNQEISKTLIQTALKYLNENGCKVIKAPVDLTIWHPYRFVVDQIDTFIMESITKDYYIKQFLEQGFKRVAKYGTGQRTDYETILPYTKPAYDFLVKEGFKIRKVGRKDLEESLKIMYKIATKTFTDSWSYVEISEEEYNYLYEDIKSMFDSLLMEIIYNPEGNPIGFCSSIYDPINKGDIVLKSIAVLPEYQNKKVGAALIYSQHKEAYEKGISRMIYALVRIGNKVTKLPYPGVEIIRKYVALEKNLN